MNKFQNFIILLFFFNYNKFFQRILNNLKEENNITKCKLYCNEKGGICTNNNLTCICKPDFDTIYIKDPIILCNYKKFNKYYSAFTELFIGFGFGHFLCDRILSGYIRLIIQLTTCFILSCFFSISVRINYEFNDSTVLNKTILYSFCIIFIILIWRIVDFILFITNKYKDGNNIKLY